MKKMTTKKQMYKSLIQAYLDFDKIFYQEPCIVFDIEERLFLSAEKDYLDCFRYVGVDGISLDSAELYDEPVTLERAKEFARKHFIEFVQIVEEKIVKLVRAIKTYREIELEVSEVSEDK